MSLKRKLLYIFTPTVLGGIVGLLIKNSIDYAVLVKPPFAPPKILFPIMWSVIYLCLGYSYYLYKNKGLDNEDTLYYTSLVFNLMWSIIFFLFKLRFTSIIWIIILDIMVYTLIYKFFKVDKKLALLNLIYAIWLLVATYLTIGIYILN